MVTFSQYAIQLKLRETDQLVRLNKVIKWYRVEKFLKGIHKNEVDPKGGQKAYDNLKMFKAILLQSWYGLSDPDTETALRVRIDFMYFTGFDAMDDTPDETTICRFRNRLVELGLAEKLFKAINKQLAREGLKVKTKGVVIDATIIESAARPDRVIEIVDDRDEPDDPPTIMIEESKDPDARWLKKGKDSYYGYKGFVATDDENGFIENLKVTPANASEMKGLEPMLKGVDPGRRAYADKGYASKENRAKLKDRQLKDGILHRAARNHPLTKLQKRFNKLVSKKRFIVEQAFGTLKRRLKFCRAGYMGLDKVTAQFHFKAMCFNLLKAINLSCA